MATRQKRKENYKKERTFTLNKHYTCVKLILGPVAVSHDFDCFNNAVNFPLSPVSHLLLCHHCQIFNVAF